MNIAHRLAHCHLTATKTARVRSGSPRALCRLEPARRYPCTLELTAAILGHARALSASVSGPSDGAQIGGAR